MTLPSVGAEAAAATSRAILQAGWRGPSPLTPDISLMLKNPGQAVVGDDLSLFHPSTAVVQ